MSFQKNKYCVIKEAVPKELAEFVYNYFLMKRQVARTLFDERYISNFTEEWGTWADQQVPGTYSHYADIAMETLLMRTLPVMEKKTGLKLYPTYSYARIYKPGDMLVYRGMELEHWREEFQGNDCCQVFLHYNDQKSKNANHNIYDTRKHLGLPSWFKK